MRFSAIQRNAHALPAVLLCLLLAAASSQVAGGDTWAAGDVRFLVPEKGKPGDVFEVPVQVETAGALLAALTFDVRWNPAAATLVEVRGGLSPRALHPFVVNDREVGRLVISDINAPQKIGEGGAVYNNLMRGRIGLYTLVLRRVGDAPLALRAEISAFHDPGEGDMRNPTAIGSPIFPRPAQVIDAGAGASDVAATDALPALGTVWHTALQVTPADSKCVATTFYTLMGDAKLGSFSLELRYDPKQLEPAGVAGANAAKPTSDWSIPGTLWISGTAAHAAAPDGVGNVALATVTFRTRQPEPPSFTGQVVSLHQPTSDDGAAPPVGELPLPRPILQR